MKTSTMGQITVPIKNNEKKKNIAFLNWRNTFMNNKLKMTLSNDNIPLVTCTFDFNFYGWLRMFWTSYFNDSYKLHWFKKLFSSMKYDKQM